MDRNHNRYNDSDYDCVVIGAGPAGLAAGLTLARYSFRALVIERADKPGGMPVNYTCKAVDACRKCGACMAAEMAYQASHNPGLSIITGAEVRRTLEDKGEFRIIVMDSQGERAVFSRGLIIAVGGSVIDCSFRPEMGYGRIPRVVNALEIEARLKRAEDWEKELGVLPRLAFIQCFGSRDVKHGVPYCSRVCCYYTEKMASLLIDRVPGATVDIFYMDKQMINKLQTINSSQNINYIRSVPARAEGCSGSGVKLYFEDPESGKPEEQVYDWVILSAAMVKNSNSLELINELGIEVDEYGFIKTWNGVETSRRGVYAAGVCAGPQSIIESVAQGRMAAERFIHFKGQSSE